MALSLVFLKFVSDKFEARRTELTEEGKEKYLDVVEFYTMKNVFYLPEEARFQGRSYKPRPKGQAAARSICPRLSKYEIQASWWVSSRNAKVLFPRPFLEL